MCPLILDFTITRGHMTGVVLSVGLLLQCVALFCAFLVEQEKENNPPLDFFHC